MKEAIDETARRRARQLAYNKKHCITPKSIVKPVPESSASADVAISADTKSMAKNDLHRLAIETEATMKKYAEQLDFENAILFREKLAKIKKAIGDPTPVSEVS
jgi:excinuclease ABC subunit B